MNQTKNGFPAGTACAIRIEAYERLLAFLDTLPDKPVEKTCKTCGFYENNCPFIRGKFIPYPNKVCKDYTFSTLKAEQEPVSEDLEEAADEYSGDPNTGFIDMTAYRAFKAGAEWMKKQIPMPEDTVIFQKGVEEGKRLMMEGAEECELYWDGDFLAIDLNMRALGYSERDKVKIIIVKEEEK